MLFGLIAHFPCHASIQFKEFLSQSVEKAYRLKVVEQRVLQKEKALNVSESTYLPNISLSLEGSLEKDPGIEQREYYGPGVDLSYDLINFQRGNQYDFAKDDLKVTQDEYKFTKQDILFQVVTTLYDYFQSKELLEVALENKNSLELNFKMVRRKNRAGDLSKVDVERSRARLLASEAALIRSKQLVETFKNRFQSLTESNLDKLMTYPILKDQKKKIELKESLTFKRFANQIKLGQQNVKIQESQNYPALKLRAFHNEEIGIGNSDDAYDSQVILSIELPLYTGGRIASQTESAQVNLNRIKKEQYAFMQELDQEIKILENTIQTDSESMKKFEQAANVAKKVVEGRRFEFDNGGGQNNLLLDAVREHLEFKRNLILTKFSILKNKTRLYWRLGRLGVNLFDNENKE